RHDQQNFTMGTFLLKPNTGRGPPRITYDDQLAFFLAFFLRVAAAFLADADLAFLDRAAEASPPFLPPFLAAEVSVFLPRPEPLFLPPPLISLTVAHARRLASFFLTPRSS